MVPAPGPRQPFAFCLYKLTSRCSHLDLAWLPRWLSGKGPACQAGDLGLIPGVGRPPEERNGNLLQYPCLENPMDRGAWWATVHRVAVIQTRLSDYICMHPSLTIMLSEVHTCCNVPSREILLRFPLQSRACYPESKSKKYRKLHRVNWSSPEPQANTPGAPQLILVPWSPPTRTLGPLGSFIQVGLSLAFLSIALDFKAATAADQYLPGYSAC